MTALMGAHTIGKADILNSGFHGTWVNNEQVICSNIRSYIYFDKRICISGIFQQQILHQHGEHKSGLEADH